MMKNILTVLGILCLLSLNVVGQGKDEPETGIALITRAIDKNTKSNKEISNRIDSINETVNAQYQRWLGIYLVATGSFLTFLYAGFSMIDSIRKKRGLKKTQVYIDELKKRIESQDKYVFQLLEKYKLEQRRNIAVMSSFTEQISQTNDILISISNSRRYSAGALNFAWFLSFGLGVAITLSFLILLVLIGGL